MRKVTIKAHGKDLTLEVPDRLVGQPGHDWIPVAVNAYGAAVGCSICLIGIIARDPDDAEEQMETLDATRKCVPIGQRVQDTQRLN